MTEFYLNKKHKN